MSSPRGKALVTPASPSTAKTEEKELDIVETIGLAKVPRGWVVVAVFVQGEKIVEREVLSREPEPRGHAYSRLQTELVKRFSSLGKARA